MKKLYEELSIAIEYFESADVITASASDYDGTGAIPESWWTPAV